MIIMKNLCRSLAVLALWATTASAASVVWTCTLNNKSLLGPGGGYLASGECVSDTGTCDTSQAAFTGAQLCGSAALTIKDVVVTAVTPNASGAGFAAAYDHANNKLRCLGTNGAATNTLADNTATALVTLSKFHFFAICF